MLLHGDIFLGEYSGVNYFSNDEYLFFKIVPVKNIEVNNDIYVVDVKYDDGLAKLCLMSQIDDLHEICEMPDEIILSKKFLENDAESYISRFSYDVLLVRVQDIDSYLPFKGSSFFWGGYIHCDDDYELPDVKRSSAEAICADYLYEISSIRHRNCLLLAAKSKYAVERFLHLYHFLELDYDYELVRKIKTLNENNPIELWGVLSQQKNDIDRLNYLMLSYDKIPFLCDHIFKIRNFTVQAERIFFTYQKESNPIKNYDEFRELFYFSTTIKQEEFQRIKMEKRLSLDLWKSEESFNKKIIDLCCYWIYRVRCSIAHNKLGDYHIEDSDLPFLVEFCEPIIIDFIKYRIRNRQ